MLKQMSENMQNKATILDPEKSTVFLYPKNLPQSNPDPFNKIQSKFI